MERRTAWQTPVPLPRVSLMFTPRTPDPRGICVRRGDQVGAPPRRMDRTTKPRSSPRSALKVRQGEDITVEGLAFDRRCGLVVRNGNHRSTPVRRQSPWRSTSTNTPSRPRWRRQPPGHFRPAVGKASPMSRPSQTFKALQLRAWCCHRARPEARANPWTWLQGHEGHRDGAHRDQHQCEDVTRHGRYERNRNRRCGNRCTHPPALLVSDRGGDS